MAAAAVDAFAGHDRLQDGEEGGDAYGSSGWWHLTSKTTVTTLWMTTRERHRGVTTGSRGQDCQKLDPPHDDMS